MAIQRISRMTCTGRFVRLGLAGLLCLGVCTTAAAASLRPSQPPSLLSREQARTRVLERQRDMQLRRERYGERRLERARRAGQTGAPHPPAVPRNPVAVPAPGTLN